MQEFTEPKNGATVFWRLAAALIRKDQKKVAEQLDENVEWVLTSNLQKISGRETVTRFLTDAWVATTKTMPELVNDVAISEWGVFEYINRGIVTPDLTDTLKAAGWLSRFSSDPSALVGRKYSQPVCFVYHLNGKGKIDIVREYLDVGSVVSQIEG